MSERPIDKVLGLLSSVKPSGDTGRQWVACCPAHADGQQSLGVARADGDVVLLKCYAGCSTAAVVAAIGLTLKDLYPSKEKAAHPRQEGVSVQRLAYEKALDAGWLRDACGLRDVPERRQVEVPYRDVLGDEVATRVRSAVRAKDGSYWKVRGTKPVLYGLWKLPEFRAWGVRELVVCEGETNCWALWAHRLPALGVPGATSHKTIQDPAAFAGFDAVVVWQDPDAAGAGFAAAVGDRLRASGYAGRVVVASVPGAKDPADVQMRHRGEFPAAWRAIVAAARDWVPPVAPNAPAPGLLPKTVERLEAALKVTGVCDWGEFEFTEAGNAGRLERLHGADLKFIKQWNAWYVWDGGRWREDATLEVYRRADRTVHSLMLEAQLAPGKPGLDEAVKWWHRSQTAKVLENTIKLARAAGRIPADFSQFDCRPWLLNCPNGTVDLRTGVAAPHRRDDLLTTLCPTPYDPNAACPTWELFLDRVFPKDPQRPDEGGNAVMIAFLQRLLGYCLTGQVLSNLLPIFWGGGSNGKSTLLDVVQDVVGGAYAMQAPPGFLMAKNTEGHPTELADLWGKRLVVATETAQNRRLDEALVKQLTGGDKIRARKMRQDHWEFSPTHKLLLCTNHRPTVRGNDHGIWRRLLLVPFQVQFWDPAKGESGHELYKVDLHMKGRLRAEAPGILAWMVRGCLDWQAKGLEQPAEVQDVTREYREEEDVLGQFLADRYVRQPTAATYLKDLHRDYSSWCETHGERPLIHRLLANELRGRGFAVRPGHAGSPKVDGLAPRSRSAESAGSEY